ncbi:sugar transferase [Burkholderiales bacterium]|nr:sugar transferase [Burkholderiales bacterium]
MIRIFDILLSLFGLLALSPIFVVCILICSLEHRSPIFSQERVGRNQKLFVILKFRSMRLDTREKPTHLVNVSQITRYGFFLRRTKLDELPQLWNVLKGDMSLVGPRPCLAGQSELIREREIREVFDARPGITGRAQLMGIDMSTPVLLAEIDSQMLQNMNLREYFLYILRTLMLNRT